MIIKLPTEVKQELLIVNEYLHQFIRSNEEDGALHEVMQTVINNTGKMLRPTLLLLTARFGPDYSGPKQRLCKLGALIELVHLASLIHDDIIDDSPLRRGRPTVQSLFGKDMAVLAGDFVLSRVVYNLLNEGFIQSGIILADAVKALCSGEMRQLKNRFNPDITVDDYFKSIQDKTASLFFSACRIGALESGCAPETIDKLSRLGEHIGIVFQMRDDLLDFVSNEAEEGKPVGADISDGIYTLPVIHALQNPTYGKDLRHAIEKNQPVKNLVQKSGGIEFAKTQIALRIGLIHEIIECQENEIGHIFTDIADWLGA